jgi:hypothetical protein
MTFFQDILMGTTFTLISVKRAFGVWISFIGVLCLAVVLSSVLIFEDSKLYIMQRV